MKAALEGSADQAGARGHAWLSKELGESEQTVTNWARRGVSKAGAMKAQARFGCSAIWILDGTEPQSIRTRSVPHSVQSPTASYQLLEKSDLTIPQYEAGGAMGNGLVLEEKQPGIIKSWSVSREWVRLNVPHYTAAANLCIVTGFGPSMKPLYNPGDPLLMDSGVNVVDAEGVYFFRVGNHGFIKQLQRIPSEDGMFLRAKSLNASYDSFNITERMMSDFQCFGKILTVWKSEQV